MTLKIILTPYQVEMLRTPLRVLCLFCRYPMDAETICPRCQHWAGKGESGNGD